MERTFKRLLSFAVALVMILGMIPVTQLEAKAETTTVQTQIPTQTMETYKSAAQINETQQQAYTFTGVLDADATGEIEAICPHCSTAAGEDVTVTWKPIPTTALPIIYKTHEHYYVPQNKDADGEIQGVSNTKKNALTGSNGDTTVYKANGTDKVTDSFVFMYLFINGKVCLHLNGSKLYTEYSAWMGDASARLNVMGDGTWTGNFIYGATSTQTWRATTIHNHSAAQVNLYSGTYNTTADRLGHAVVTNGVSTSGKITIHKDAVIDGDVFVRAGTITLDGGRINGRVMLKPTVDLTATFTMNSGSIAGGPQEDHSAKMGIDDRGGVIHSMGGVVNVNGGTINGLGTEAAPYEADGAAIFVGGFVDGSKKKEGSLTVGAAATINGGVVKGANGGAIAIAGSGSAYPTATINGRVAGGKAIPNVVYDAETEKTTAEGGLGGNIYAYDAAVTIGSTSAAAGTTVITQGQAYQGGNVFYDEDAGSKGFVVNKSALISYGKALPASDGEGHSVTSTIGGNVRADYSTSVYGEIAHGDAEGGLAGNLYVNGATLTCKTGSNIHHGTARIAGNVYNSWKFNLEAGATIADGTAESAGNIYYEDNNAYVADRNNGTINRSHFKIYGTVTRGTATLNGGGNIYNANPNMDVTVFGSVTDGKCLGTNDTNARGGNIWMAKSGTVATVVVGVDSGAAGVVSGGEARHGGNIYAPNINIKATGKVSGGKADKNGANLYVCAGGVSYVYGEVDGAVEGADTVCTSGATLYVAGTGTAHIYGTLKNGRGSTNGGNIAANNGDVYVYPGAKVLNGYAEGTLGGGNIYIGAGGGLFITGGEFIGGKAPNAGGGNIMVADGRYSETTPKTLVEVAHLSIENATISDGEAGAEGGNILVNSNAEVSFKNTTITGGKAKVGGSINIKPRSANFTETHTVLFDNVTVQGGQASGGSNSWEGGGNLYLSFREYTFNNCTISGGKSPNKNGGNVTLTERSVATFNNCSILDGETGASGANLYITGGNAVLNNSTVKGGSGRNNIYAAYGVEADKDIDTLVVNGGTIGAADDAITVALYTRKANGFDKITVNDGTVYGTVDIDEAGMGNLAIYHGQFTVDPTAFVQGEGVVVRQTDGMYGVHVPGEGTANPAPSCTEGGVTDWTCTYTYTVDETTYDCDGYSVAEDMIEHTFDQKNTDEKYLKSAATCKDLAVYYFSCACGETGTETFTVEGYAAHKPVAQDGKNPEIGVPGWEAYYKCSVCEKLFSDEACANEIEKPVEIPALEEDGAAKIGDVTYDTFAEALAAVQKGEQIDLYADVEVAELTVPTGVKLNLNGKTVKVTDEDGYVCAFTKGAAIIDESEGNTGRLDVAMDMLRLLGSGGNGGYLPVQMNGGIMFVEAASGQGKKPAGNYQCWIGSVDSALIEALKTNNASELGLEFQVVLTWGDNRMKYTFKDETVAKYMADWEQLAMFLKVSGAEGIEDLTYQARIVFGDDTTAEVVLWAGETVAH